MGYDIDLFPARRKCNLLLLIVLEATLLAYSYLTPAECQLSPHMLSTFSLFIFLFLCCSYSFCLSSTNSFVFLTSLNLLYHCECVLFFFLIFVLQVGLSFCICLGMVTR